MNKAIYICAAAVLVLTSCSNDEIVERAKENVISFRSMVGMNTRAVNMTQSELEAKGMYVTTFDENGDLLYPETHYELDRSVWMANPAQSWGVHDKLNFFLVSPKLSEWQTGFELTKDNKEAYVSVDEKIASQKDYVMANVTASKTDGSVSVGLKHVLSSIEIWAKNTNEAFTYKVKGIRLCGVNTKMLFSFSEGKFEWNVMDFSPKDYELTYLTPTTLGSEPVSVMGSAKNAILLPQTEDLINKWNGTDVSDSPGTYVGKYISVLINITSKYGASVYPAGSTTDNETYGWVAIPVEFIWESGKKYVYTLDFSEGAGRVDPTDPGVSVTPDGVTDPKKGNPILGTRIKFGLVVSTWGSAESDATLTDDIKFSVGVDSWTDDEKDAEIN